MLIYPATYLPRLTSGLLCGLLSLALWVGIGSLLPPPVGAPALLVALPYAGKALAVAEQGVSHPLTPFLDSLSPLPAAPHAEEGDTHYTLESAHSDTTYPLHLGVQYPLSYEEGDMRLVTHPTPGWLAIYQEREGQLTISVGVEGASGQGEAFVVASSCVPCPRVLAASALQPPDPELARAAHQLHTALWTGPDQLSVLHTRTYGEATLLYLGQRQSLPLKTSMTLSWDQDAWQAGAQPTCLSAHLLAVRDEAIEWEVRTANGQARMQVTTPPFTPPPARTDMSKLLTHLERKGPGRVVGRLQGRTISLQAGDWLYARKGRWEVITSPPLRAEIAAHPDKGELCIIDSCPTLEPPHVLRATLFSPYRVATYPLSLSVREG